MIDNKFIQLSKELKNLFEIKTNLKFKRRVLKMRGNNPFIEIALKEWENNNIPNDIRVLIAKTLNINPLNLDNVVYGNIRENYITLYYNQWLNVIEVLKNENNTI